MLTEKIRFDHQGTAFSQGCAAMLVVLLASTWPLWWSTNIDHHPLKVPLALENLIGGWGGVDHGFTLILVATLLTLSLPQLLRRFPKINRLWWIVVIALAGLFLSDQHRLQPWAYQAFLYAFIFATSNNQGTKIRQRLLMITISIYLFSALGKFDFQFAHTLGRGFVEQLWSLTGNAPLTETAASRMSLALPATELIAAVGLCFPPTRKLAALLVVGMHALLIGLLGPWGQNHSLGVLTWNLALMIQAGYFFAHVHRRHQADPSSTELNRPSPPPTPRSQESLLSHTRWIGWPFIAIALLAPLGERWGYWDHWLSWSLYAPHTSRVDVQLHRSSIADLPTSLEPFLQPDSDGDGWRTLALQDWSIKAQRVPIYPQARYQLAVADQLATSYHLDDRIRATEKSVSDRWTGERTETFLWNQREISKHRQDSRFFP